MSKNNVLVFAEFTFDSAAALANYVDDFNASGEGLVRIDKVAENADGTVTAKLDAFLSESEAVDIAFGRGGGTVINARKYAYGRKTFKSNPMGTTAVVAPVPAVTFKKNRS